jgi:hypothetical protein
MLIGLSAKNAILYLDFVVERIGKMPFKDALIEAGSLRFRPIVMTTLTVLVTSFPLIFGAGQGSEFGQGLGVVTFGGILFSAVLTFFVVPAAFYTFEKNRQNVSFNAAKAEIDQACAELEAGVVPEGCEPEGGEGPAEGEVANVPTTAASVAPAVTHESASSPTGLADAPGRSRRKRKLPEPPEGSEEYGL